MSKLLLILAFVLPSAAHADLGWFLLGSMMTSSPKTEVVYKDQFSMTVDEIRQQIPSQYEKYSKAPYYTFHSKQAKDLKEYFENFGYSVSAEGNELRFDFKSKYEAYVSYQQEMKLKTEKWMAFLGGVFQYLKFIGLLVLIGVAIHSVVTAFKLMDQFILGMGPRSVVFQAYDYKGRLTKKYKKQQRDMKDNWKIICPDGTTRSLNEIERDSKQS